ncbi:MAG: PLDc N-terminal domain-containing protein, partial [Acidaminobacteraceae bacterium]
MEKIIKQILFIAVLILGVYFTYQVYLGFLNLNISSSPIYLWGKRFVAINFTIYIAAIAIVILLENKNPSKTISWLMVLFLFPVIGFVFYILFGRSMSYKFRTRRKIKHDINRLSRAADIQREIIDYIDLFQDDSKVNNKLLNLLLKNSDTPFTINNRVEVLTNGDATFDKIISELLLADDHIHMEYFIIRDDEIGNRIKDILILKAKAGVEVRVIYDSVGSWKLGSRYIGALKEAGVKVNSFFPVALPLISRELNYRNHRKIIVIDGCVGFVGGLNIGDEYLGKNAKIGFWRDTHLMLAGDSVYSLQQIFVNDWLQ